MAIDFKRLVILAAALAFSVLFWSAPASAQATRTWISGVGDDANPCSRTAPCKTFAGAISKTAAGGEINCLDPGGFGAITITKAITLVCDNLQQAGILVAATNGVIIAVPAGTFVTLSGLYIDGLGSTGVAGVNGVNITQGGNIVLRNLTITGFRNGYGVNFANQQAGKLTMHNVTVTESGLSGSASTGGVLISPAAGISAEVHIFDSRIFNNENVALRLDTVGFVGSTIRAMIDNVSLSSNTIGVLVKAPSNTGTVNMMIANSRVANNSGQGIIANGTATSAVVRVGNTSITGNGTGVLPLGTALLQSYGDNRLDGNTTDGTFSGTIAKR